MLVNNGHLDVTYPSFASAQKIRQSAPLYIEVVDDGSEAIYSICDSARCINMILSSSDNVDGLPPHNFDYEPPLLFTPPRRPPLG